MSKFRILQNQTSADAFIYCSDDPITNEYLPEVTINAHSYPFSIKKKLEEGAWLEENEIHIKTNTNQMLYIEEVGSPVIDDVNHLIGRLMVLRDITEEKKLEEYRNEITGMAVHDLRAPLSAIINALQIAAERIETPSGIPVVKRTIAMGLSNADDMLTQVNTLLDIRKGREMTLDRAPTEIEEVIETPNHDVYVTGKAMIPAHPDFIVSRDIPQKMIVVRDVPGLLNDSE